MVLSTKYGWNINGAYDGFGRWVNTDQNFVRMSDGQVNNPSAAYTTATANAFNWDIAADAKITVSATRVFSGQDTFVTTGFGADDGIDGFFDEYPGETNNMQGGADFSSAVWVLIKLPEGASGSGGSGTNYWAANGNDVSNTNSGSVGIGTDTPDSKLDVKGPSASPADGNQTLSITNTTGGTQLNLGTAENSYGWIEAREGATLRNLLLQPNGGNVGIGTTNPGSKLEVDGTINFNASGDRGFICSPSQGTFSLGDIDEIGGGAYLSTDSTNMNFYASGNNIARLTDGGTLTVTGDVVAYGSPSDERLKENIKPIKSALDKVMKLQGVTFDWKQKEDVILDIKEDIGFIAQDVQKVVPELIRENSNGLLSMRHQGITPILLEAIKELKAEIDLLKSKPCTCNKCNCNI